MGIPPVVDGPYESADTCLDALKKEQERLVGSGFLQRLAEAAGMKEFTFGEFKPVAFYNQGMDMLVYLERDSSYTSHYIPGSNIEILRDNHKDNLNNIIGININQFSLMVSKEVIAAFNHRDKEDE